MSQEERVRDSVDQLFRYGEVKDERLLELLECLTDVNDDLHHNRATEVVLQQCLRGVGLLASIYTSYKADEIMQEIIKAAVEEQKL